MWNLIELFTNMDLAQLSALIDSELIPSLDIAPYDGRGLLTEASASLSNPIHYMSSPNLHLDVVRNIGELIEQHLAAQTPAGEDAEFVAYSLTSNDLADLCLIGPSSHLPMAQ